MTSQSTTLVRCLLSFGILGLLAPTAFGSVTESLTQVVVLSTGSIATDTANLTRGVDLVHMSERELVLVQSAPDKPFRLNRPLSFQGQDGAGKSLVVTGRMRWHGIEYHGPPKTAAFELSGVKMAKFEGIQVILHTQGTTGIGLGVGKLGQRDQSSSFVQFIRCAVQFAPDKPSTVNKNTNLGWHIGRIWTPAFVTDPRPENRGHADICKISFDTCRGDWLVSGGNTLDLLWSNCAGRWTLIDTEHPALSVKHPQGGSASTWINCNGGHDDYTWRLPGGFSSTILGGRTEHIQQAVVVIGPGRMGDLLIHGHDGINGSNKNAKGLLDLTWKEERGRKEPRIFPAPDTAAPVRS